MRTKSLAVVFLMLLSALSAFAQTGKPASKDGLVKVSGVSYRDVGNRKSKSAIVFIHGWTCSADFWRDSINAFPGKRVIAVDLPSGLDCDTGQPWGACVRANHTATMVSVKAGFARAAEYTGEVHLIDIGIPRRLLTAFDP